MAKPKVKPSDLIISHDEQEHLILVYHAARTSLELSHAEAVGSPTFWARVQSDMELRECKKEDTAWQHHWHRMRSKLLVRIEQARRRRYTNSAWLTMLNSQLLTVVLDTLDRKHLEYLERCMADDVQDEDDRFVLCATVYRDMGTIDDRFMMRCQNCRETFNESAELLEHIREYCAGQIEQLVPSSDDDDDVSVVEPPVPSQLPVIAVGSSEDEDTKRPQTDRSDSENYWTTSADAVKAPTPPTPPPPPMDQSLSPSTIGASKSKKSPKVAGVNASIDPNKFGFVTDASNSDSSHISSGDLSDNSIKVQKYCPIKCTFEGCPERFPSQRQHIIHSRTVHNRRPYSCRICSRQFDTEVVLNQHIAEHGQTFECDVCKKVFSGYWALTTHMRIHGPKIYPCTVCGMKFAILQTAQRHHMSVHQKDSEKRFVCEQCGKAFHLQSKLKCHLETHNADSERPQYKCELCDSVSLSKAYAARHMMQHKVQLPYECRHTGCGQKYRCYKSRLQHEIRDHGSSGRVLATGGIHDGE